jgi:hypothetical protein
MKTPPLAATIAIMLALLLLAGCASDGLKSYQKGDYFSACEEAVEMLRRKPDNTNAKQALTNAYPLAQSSALRDIAAIASAGNYINYDKAVALYDRLDQIAGDIRRCPAALDIISNPPEYYKERGEAAENMARALYDAGVAALSRGTIEQARVASGHFAKIIKYLPGYRDAAEKYAQARDAATLRVAVARLKTPAKYQNDADSFHARFMTEMDGRPRRDPVRFYTHGEASAQGAAQPHRMLALDFEDFTIGKSRETSRTSEHQKDNVVTGTVTGPDGKPRDVTGKVKAKLTLHRLELVSDGALMVRVIDTPTGRVLNQKKIAARHVWSAEWARFNGDQRALTPEQIKLAQKRPATIPADQELFRQFASLLYSETAQYINSIYK